jgi:hypothetical protein
MQATTLRGCLVTKWGQFLNNAFERSGVHLWTAPFRGTVIVAGRLTRSLDRL